MKDRWEGASAYDRFMGRWSRELARTFVGWLRVPSGAKWLEIGCGTGSLTAALCELARPASVVACDTAPDFVRYCQEQLRDPALRVVAVGADELPSAADGFDAVVSSLVLNFLPAPVEALARMRSACSREGVVAACVWDYASGMEFLRLFWDEATALDPAARPLDEGARFPLCEPGALRTAFRAAGLREIDVDPISVPTLFANFDDFWTPLLGGAGPAPTYVASLGEGARGRLRDRLRARLQASDDAPIRLQARAWAVRGRR